MFKNCATLEVFFKVMCNYRVAQGKWHVPVVQIFSFNLIVLKIILRMFLP